MGGSIMLTMNREMMESFGAPDTFVTGLGSVEDVGGGCWRFTFFTTQGREHVVAARLVIPNAALHDAMHMTATATNSCACMQMRGLTKN